jgi:YbbR domain-containing protein
MSKKKKNKLLDSKVLWAVISLLASLFIWVYITGTQEEIITQSFNNVEVQFVGEDTLQATRGYVVNNISAETVSVKISGTRGNIGSLSASDVKAVIDVSLISSTGRLTQYFTLTYPDNVNADAVSLESSNPETISFDVTRMSKKPVPVEAKFVGSTAEDYIAGEIEFEPKTIWVSGPESELEKIDHIYVEMGGDDLTMTRTADIPVVLIDTDGNTMDSTGLEFDVPTVTVTIPISMMKEVPLYIQCVYGAGATEANTVIKIEPSTITISGDTSVVSGINRIDLTTIDLTDFSLTFQDTFSIPLQDGVENVTGTTQADVSIEITGVDTKIFTLTNISYRNLPSGYTVEEITTRSLEVRIRAPQDVLDQIQPSNLSAVADLSDISQSGDMFVPVRIIVDGFTDVGAVGDYSIGIRIKN